MLAEVLVMISRVEDEISRCEHEISRCEEEIKQESRQCDRGCDAEEKRYLRKKKELLCTNELQLRKEKELLREEKLLLMKKLLLMRSQLNWDGVHALKKIELTGLPSRYEVIRAIGEGNQACVYKAFDHVTGSHVAVKYSGDDRTRHILMDGCVLLRMKRLSCSKVLLGGPWTRFDSVRRLRAACFVMELMGVSLRELACSSFTAGLVLKFAGQLVHCLQELHDAGYLHMSLKPENIMVNGDFTRVHLIDFGRSRPFVTMDNKHVPKYKGHRLRGSFQSLNAQQGFYSRRDDIIAVANILLWMNHKIDDSKQRESIGNALESFLLSAQCLEYSEEPLYSNYFDLFRDEFFRICGRVHLDMHVSPSGSVRSYAIVRKSDAWFLLSGNDDHRGRAR